MADALVVMAESFLAHGAVTRPGGDRHLVVVHVDADVLASGGDGAASSTPALLWPPRWPAG
ncbi:MAG: hypothetical protein ACR2K0_04975 [Acidimicrobiales bacterium]